MRQLIIFIVILVLLISNPIKAEIKNGFTAELKIAQKSVLNLRHMLNSSSISKLQRRILVKKIKFYEKSYHRIILDEQRTEEVISLVKTIHPKLFYSLSTIQDKMGNLTDIYVKAIKNFGVYNGIYGTTNLSSVNQSIHECTSIYGRNSVSIKINGGEKALHFLVHEFGHALYIVPKLKSYLEFYRNTYNNRNDIRGHRPSDPSHAYVKKILKDFYIQLKKYRKQIRIGKLLET